MLSSGPPIADLNPAERPASFKYRSPSFSQSAWQRGKSRNPIMFLRKRNVFWHHFSVYQDHIRQQKTLEISPFNLLIDHLMFFKEG